MGRLFVMCADVPSVSVYKRKTPTDSGSRTSRTELAGWFAAGGVAEPPLRSTAGSCPATGAVMDDEQRG